MSPALQKLRKDLDQAKARSKGADAAAAAGGGHPNSVGFDVMDLLFSALVAQDAELRKLKAERNASDVADIVSDTGVPAAAGSSFAHVKTDAYVGHTAANETSPIYSAKQLKPAHG